jgi:hypothetical protein
MRSASLPAWRQSKLGLPSTVMARFCAAGPPLRRSTMPVIAGSRVRESGPIVVFGMQVVLLMLYVYPAQATSAMHRRSHCSTLATPRTYFASFPGASMFGYRLTLTPPGAWKVSAHALKPPSPNKKASNKKETQIQRRGTGEIMALAFKRALAGDPEK